VRRILNIGIGIITFFLGAAAVYDIFHFLKSGSAEGMILQLPAPVKRQIHKVIGMAYRRRPDTAVTQPRIHPARLALTAFITGCLVSLLEAVCTGQVYVPTIAFVLKSSSFRLQAAAYLILYNIMFIIPLVVILGFALAGVSSGQFSKFLHRHFVAVKTALACMFFLFAFFLIWG